MFISKGVFLIVSIDSFFTEGFWSLMKPDNALSRPETQ
jgi:hypothetical protein